MSCAKVNMNNKSTSEIYSQQLEHPHEDILKVIKLEEEEQARRVADKEGENHKRVLALNWSVMFEENLRATWFQRGSSFVLSLLGSVRSAVTKKASTLTSTVSSTAGDLGHKAAVNLQHKAEDVNVKAQEVAHNLAHGLQEKSLETAHNVSAFAQEKASGATSFLSGKVQEYSQRIKDAMSISFYGALSSFTNNVNTTFELMEQEEERARRMTSSDEKYAIENALKVAALFKGHSTSHSISLHNTFLLEEAERSRRIFAIKNDKAALDHAKDVAGLIHKTLNAPAPTPIPVAEVKVEQVEPILKKPFAAAM